MAGAAKLRIKKGEVISILATDVCWYRETKWHKHLVLLIQDKMILTDFLPFVKTFLIKTAIFYSSAHYLLKNNDYFFIKLRTNTQQLNLIKCLTVFQEAAQLARTCWVFQFTQSFGFNLANTFASDIEFGTNLFESVWTTTTNTKPQTNDLLFAVG